jgi:hypothetical protein
MKKTILLAAALLPGALFAQNKEITTNQYEIKRGERMGNCSGNKENICEFAKTEQSITFMSKTISNQLRISINISALSEEEQQSWLGKPLKDVRPDETLVFNQEYNTELNPELVRDLELDSKYRFIAKGEHIIKLNNNNIELLLNLCEREE